MDGTDISSAMSSAGRILTTLLGQNATLQVWLEMQSPPCSQSTVGRDVSTQNSMIKAHLQRQKTDHNLDSY
jgi:hypothetical protein